ncbi:hypothetical protein I2486_21315 [Cellulophaga sp. E16_2]|uniref:hypothetical protein n=1 Tax=Cellulophaga sp. E16_2 TaxID=2789297 RepID=UPI001A91E216|nr:hypothetical protein [Cellulophaga sp. E16_2]MBO0593947.1 hypothetical protein [Cellulophaga sp. E16_2]
MKKLLCLVVMTTFTLISFSQSIPTTGDTLNGGYRIQILNDNGTKPKDAFGELILTDDGFSIKSEGGILKETIGLFNSGSPVVGGDMLSAKVLKFRSIKGTDDKGYLKFAEVKEPEQFPICLLTIKTSLKKYKYTIRIFEKID